MAHSQSEAARPGRRPPPPPGTDGPQNQLTSPLLSESHLCLRLHLLHSKLPHRGSGVESTNHPAAMEEDNPPMISVKAQNHFSAVQTQRFEQAETFRSRISQRTFAD